MKKIKLLKEEFLKDNRGRREREAEEEITKREGKEEKKEEEVRKIMSPKR